MSRWKTYISFPRELLERIDAHAEQLMTDRASTIRILLTQALDAAEPHWGAQLSFDHIADAHITEEE